MKSKLTSRKFWMAVAAVLASIATNISGIQSGNDILATVGAICAVASMAIYAGCEAYVDKAAVGTSSDTGKESED